MIPNKDDSRYEDYLIHLYMVRDCYKKLHWQLQEELAYILYLSEEEAKKRILASRCWADGGERNDKISKR